jgi:phage-related tail fiber protein
MAQSDQSVQNATFPSVRADINDNLAALYSQSSGNSEPTVTVAFQLWVDTSSSPPVWKVRNGSNSAWITVGVLDPAGFNTGGITAIANGGTSATTATGALTALLPSQGGNSGKALITDGSVTSWGTASAAGEVAYFAINTAPSGYLKANGAAISRSTYSTLFAAIGTTFGVGDGSTTFNVPDLRGEFIRGWADGRSVDTGRTFGSFQDQSFASHTHSESTSNSNNVTTYAYSSGEGAMNVNSGLTGTTTGAAGGTETRPRNIALLACIKF